MRSESCCLLTILGLLTFRSLAEPDVKRRHFDNLNGGGGDGDTAICLLKRSQYAREDLSLFQLGLDLLEHFLDEYLPIPVAFQMPALAASVRW